MAFQLPVGSTSSKAMFEQSLTPDTAALLTRFKPEGNEKFTLRPYTPTSDEGMFSA